MKYYVQHTHLHAVEAGGAVVAADAVENPLDVADLVRWAAAVHAADRLPAVPLGTEPLARGWVRKIAEIKINFLWLH